MKLSQNVITATNAWIPAFVFRPERMVFQGLRTEDPNGQSVVATFKQYTKDVARLSQDELATEKFRIKEIPYKRMDLNNLPFPRGVNDILDVTLENVVAYLVRSGFDVVDEDLSVTVDGGTVTIAATESSLLYCGSFTVGAVAY